MRPQAGPVTEDALGLGAVGSSTLDFAAGSSNAFAPEGEGRGSSSSLGGMKRGQPLPKDREIFTVHYRNWDIVKEYGLSRQAKDMLQAHAGVRRMAQIGKGAEAAE